MRQLNKCLFAMLKGIHQGGYYIGNCCQHICFNSNMELIDNQSKNSYYVFQDKDKMGILSLDHNLDLKLKCCFLKGYSAM